jgi:hypothetical protein
MVMTPSEFMAEFERTFRVDVKPISHHEKKYGNILGWEPEIEIQGRYDSDIYEIQKIALQQGMPLWAEDTTLLIDEDGFKEIIHLIKIDWGEE